MVFSREHSLIDDFFHYLVHIVLEANWAVLAHICSVGFFLDWFKLANFPIEGE